MVWENLAKQHRKAEREEFASRVLSLLDVLDAFGIVAGTETLRNDFVSPERCMAEAHTTLDLYGYGGDKWREEAWFEDGIERLARRNGRVRFLVSSAIDTRARARYRELQSKFKSTFEVYTFESPSIFRLVTIDNQWSVFTHYGNEVINQYGINAKGWESPQLLIDHSADWSLAVPLRRVFADALESAERLWPDAHDASQTVRKFERVASTDNAAEVDGALDGRRERSPDARG